MAKLIVLLCLTVLLGVALAHGTRSMSRGRPSNSMGRREGGRFHRPMHRAFGRRGEDGGAERGWHVRRGRWEGRGAGRVRDGVRRMMQSSFKPSETMGHRIPRQRSMDNLREDFSRFRQSQGRDFPDLRTAFNANGRRPRWDRYDAQIDMMERSFGQRGRAGGYLGNDLRDQDRGMGSHHAMRLGPGHSPVGQRRRGPGAGSRYTIP